MSMHEAEDMHLLSIAGVSMWRSACLSIPDYHLQEGSVCAPGRCCAGSGCSWNAGGDGPISTQVGVS